MEYVYSVFIDNSHLGDVHQIGNAYVLFFMKVHNGPLHKVHFRIKTEDKDGDIFKVVPDEPLRTLSSQPYIINIDRDMLYKGDLYETYQSIPSCCRYMAIPAINIDQIADYEATCSYDKIFIYEGYATELSKAIYVIIPAVKCTDISDFLIEKVDGDIYTSFTGRHTTIHGTPTSRYIHIPTCPIFEGQKKNLPFSYTPSSIIAKFNSINERLQSYGRSRVQSMVQALRCASNRMITETNQFEASQSYDNVVSLIRSLR